MLQIICFLAVIFLSMVMTFAINGDNLDMASSLSTWIVVLTAVGGLSGIIASVFKKKDQNDNDNNNT